MEYDLLSDESNSKKANKDKENSKCIDCGIN